MKTRRLITSNIIGAHRSPVRSLEDFVNIVELVKYSPHVELTGVMAYEAHLAGNDSFLYN